MEEKEKIQKKSTKSTAKKKAEPKKMVKKESTKEEKIETKKEIKKQEPEIREVIVEKKSGFNYIEVIIIMIITLILGGMIGSFITYMIPHTNDSTTVIKEIPKELREFVNTYNNIVSDYYEDIDHDKLLEAGIGGMLDYLDDDYSVYMNQEESESFNEQVEGKYIGIGIEITQQEDGSVKITDVFNNTPASKAGLKIGDTIIAVRDENVEGLVPSDISTKIKEGDNKVKIKVRRDDKEIEFTLSLEEVELESVTSEVFEKNDKKIGYLGLSVFAANTYEQFEKKLLELEGQNIDSLIIDVRDNSGGYLSTVTDIASLFLNKSKVIYQLDTKGVVEQIYSKTNTDREYPISVLINHNSASASEILAAALQESYGATIIGVNSFGKGTVQKAYQLESGATVKYTIQKWLTPNGNWVHEVGVIPDIEVQLEIEYYQNPNNDNDSQLQKALEELSK